MKKKVLVASIILLMAVLPIIDLSVTDIMCSSAETAELQQITEISVGIIFEDDYYYRDSYRNTFLASMERVHDILLVNGTINITYDVSYLEYTNSKYSVDGVYLSTAESDFIFDAYSNDSSIYASDVIVAVGRGLYFPLIKYSKIYSDKQYFLIEKLITREVNTSYSNVAYASYNETNGAFLAGVAAATQFPEVSNFGVITDFPKTFTDYGVHSNQYTNGFCIGVQYARGNEKVDFFIENIGKNPFDPTITNTTMNYSTKSIADQMFSKGVGVVLAATGCADGEIYRSAEENGAYVVATNSDEDNVSSNVFTSIVKNFTAPLYDYFSTYSSEILSSSKAISFHYNINDGIGITDLSSYAGNSGETVELTLETVSNVTDLLINGELSVPELKIGISPGFEWLISTISLALVIKIKKKRKK
ncbi:MAG: BMP family ABC transporter substrate-binding protein [Candidatus Hodarchaeales archaeon]